MSVYFLLDGACASVKIGYSAKPQTRVGSLQTSSPHRLNLLGVIDGDIDVEQSWHARFAAQRTRGKWFRLDGELLNAIVEALMRRRTTCCEHCRLRDAEFDADVAAELAEREETGDDIDFSEGAWCF